MLLFISELLDEKPSTLRRHKTICELKLLVGFAQISPLATQVDQRLFQCYCLLSAVIHLEQTGKDSQKSTRATMTLSAVDERPTVAALHMKISELANQLAETYHFVCFVGHFEIRPAPKMEKGHFTLPNDVIVPLA